MSLMAIDDKLWVDFVDELAQCLLEGVIFLAVGIARGRAASINDCSPRQFMEKAY